MMWSISSSYASEASHHLSIGALLWRYHSGAPIFALVQGRALLIDDGANDAGDDGQDQRAEHGPPEAVYKDTDTEEADGQPTG